MTAAAEVVVAVLVIGAAELGVASAKTLALIAVVALVMAPLLVLHWHLGRKTTVQGCRWCFDRTFGDPGQCTCDTECGKTYCMRATVLTMLEGDDRG